jgi:uncharacterized membrane protein
MSWRERVLETVDRQRWLDQVGDAAAEVVQPILARPDAREAVSTLRGDQLGHPLHPALTDLPIGFWSASLLLDLLWQSRAAGILSAAGSAAAVGAAAAGVVDWTQTEGRSRRLGVLHGLLNTSALGLQLCSLGARVRRRRMHAVTYSLLGLSVASASAWLGGELVFGDSE